MIALKLIFAASLFACVCCKRPNIVVIVADDLGWGDVSFHGSRQIATPNIDALASDGIILNNFYVSPICSPTRSALLSGRHPITLGTQNGVIRPGEPWGLPLTVTTLPQWLQALNYSTVGVGKWHLGYHRRAFIPTERGFDHYFGLWNGHSDYYTREAQSNVVHNASGRGIDFHRDAEQENVTKYKNIYSTELYADKAVEYMLNHTKTSKDRPLFVYIAHQAVHEATGRQPLQAPEKYTKRFGHIKDNKRKIFAGMVSALDDSVARVMEGLEKAGILNNTIVLFTTDNGGAVAKNQGIRSNMPIRGAKGSLWEGGVRATAFIWSKLLPKKYISDHLMHVTDIPVTLFGAAGGDASDFNKLLEGIDFWQTLKKNSTSPRKHLLHNIYGRWAVREGDYKLKTNEENSNLMFVPSGYNQTVIYRNMTDWNPEPEKSTVAKILEKLNGKRIQVVKSLVDCRQHKESNCKKAKQVCLFDIRKDPCEFNDISQHNPDVVKRLTELMMRYNATAVPSAKLPLDPKSLPENHNGRWSVWLD